MLTRHNRNWLDGCPHSFVASSRSRSAYLIADTTTTVERLAISWTRFRTIETQGRLQCRHSRDHRHDLRGLLCGERLVQVEEMGLRCPRRRSSNQKVSIPSRNVVQRADSRTTALRPTYRSLCKELERNSESFSPERRCRTTSPSFGRFFIGSLRLSSPLLRSDHSRTRST